MVAEKKQCVVELHGSGIMVCFIHYKIQKYTDRQN
jgi:hypothetical protein